MSLPILYIKPGCPWCDEVIDFLRRKRIEVETGHEQDEIVHARGAPPSRRDYWGAR